MARKVADGRWVVDREDDEWVTETAPPAPPPEDDEWTLLEDHVVLREGDEMRCGQCLPGEGWTRAVFYRGRPIAVRRAEYCPHCEFRRKEPAGGVGADEHSEKEPKQ